MKPRRVGVNVMEREAWTEAEPLLAGTYLLCIFYVFIVLR